MLEINPTAQINLEAGAEIDPTGQYRYKLWRSWRPNNNTHKTFDQATRFFQFRITWIMLNPSTADAVKNDATIRQIIALSKLWGYSSLDVFNMFAFRATNPKELLSHPEPVGPENDQYLRSACANNIVVLAWGAWGSKFPARVAAIHEILAGSQLNTRKVMCLGFTKDGQPVHPLRLPHSTPLVPY